MMNYPLNMLYIEHLIDRALDEDIGTGDVTTSAIFGASGGRVTANLVARQDGVLCGVGIFEKTILRLDGTALFKVDMKDGDFFHKGDVLREVNAEVCPLLSAERVALNFLQHLSGVATLTAKYVKAVAGTKARITDTRKTIPGLRPLEKYAVRCGGGHNHRQTLADMVLIKDNHIAYAGGIKPAVELVRRNSSHALKIEVEVNRLEQIKDALESQVDVIMLDNMDVEEMRSAVQLVGDKALVEASGGVNLDNVREIAECGVDIISVGRLTHSAAGVDISLDFEER